MRFVHCCPVENAKKTHLHSFTANNSDEYWCNSNLFAENFQKLIIQTIITWAKSDMVADQNLIRAMFSLFHRQYDGVAEVI